jgi:uroporphyrinogen III methyltransferase/synthase
MIIPNPTSRPDRATPGVPLRGLTFLNTREAGQAQALTRPLKRLGARVIERPTIAFAPPDSWLPFDEALARLRPGQWVVFTSAAAARFAMERLERLGRDAAALAGARIAAVGAGTAEALGRHGLQVALVPERYQAEGLLEALVPLLRPGEPVWHPRAEEARVVLEESLRNAGAELVVTPVYRTIVPPEGLGPVLRALRGGEIDWICFTSASSVRHFAEMLPADAGAAARAGPPSGPRIACLGQITAGAAREIGFAVDVVPERQDIPGLVEAIVAAVREGGRPGRLASPA